MVRDFSCCSRGQSCNPYFGHTEQDCSDPDQSFVEIVTSSRSLNKRIRKESNDADVTYQVKIYLANHSDPSGTASSERYDRRKVVVAGRILRLSSNLPPLFHP